MTRADEGPLFTVTGGVPTVEQLAALVALLGPSHVASAPTPAEPAMAVARWAERSAGLRRPLPSEPNAWLASSLPR